MRPRHNYTPPPKLPPGKTLQVAITPTAPTENITAGEVSATVTVQIPPEQVAAARATLLAAGGARSVSISVPIRERQRGPDGRYGVVRHIDQHFTEQRLGVLLALHDGYVASGELAERRSHIDALWLLLDQLAEAMEGKR